MSNEISLQQSLNQLMTGLSDSDKKELAKYAIHKQLEIDAEITRAKQSGLLQENDVNSMISKAAAAAAIDTQGKRSTTIDSTIRSTDGRIVTRISSKRTVW